MTRRIMSHRIKPAKKCVDAKRASARTFTSAHHFHNENQMIKSSSHDELLGLVITVYHFLLDILNCRIASPPLGVITHFITGHSDVVLLGRGFSHFSSGGFFGYRIRDEEMRWYHQSEARHAFLKRDDFLLGVSRLKYYFYNEKE